MKEFPNWVPSGVVAVYRELDQDKENVPRFLNAQEYIDTLRRCILSTQMETAWKVIQKMSDKCDPEEIANTIVNTTISCRAIRGCPPTASDIAKYGKLSRRVRAISSDFDDVVKFPSLLWVAQERPQKYLEDLATRLDLNAKHLDNSRRTTKRYSGKLNSESAVATYVVRHLYEQIQKLYQQPLHDVVAAIASEILGKPVDPESARSLYRISQV